MIKTYQQYLDAAGGNHEAALKAMHADLATLNSQLEGEAGNSIRARLVLKTLEPTLNDLGLPLPPANQRPTEEMLKKLGDEAGAVLQGIEALEESRDAWQEIAELGGLDVEALAKADTPEKAEEMVNDWVQKLEAGNKRLAQLDAQEHLDAVAAVAGWDAETFASLAGMVPGQEWRVQEIQNGEEKTKVAQVKVGNDWKAASEYAETNWKKLLPVLQTSESNPNPVAEPDLSPRVPTGGAGGGAGRRETVAEAEARKASSGDYRM